MDLLRAHFRAEEAFADKALDDIWYRLPYCRNHRLNGAGDLTGIMIEDGGTKDLERLLGSDL